MMGSFPALDGTFGFAKGVWNMLRDRGVWTVPRCGLIYQKREGENVLALIERMPWDEGMPLAAEELREFQDDDHEGIGQIFNAIGITVVDHTDGKGHDE
jgi:hypothetical protein